MDENKRDIDMSGLGEDQVLAALGDMFLGLLSSHKVAIAVQREDGVVTFVNPTIISSIPPQEMAETLLESWEEEDILKLMGHIYG